jgi:hypothetical protein
MSLPSNFTKFSQPHSHLNLIITTPTLYIIIMLGRTAIIALFASAATAATVATRASNNYGDGMFIFPLLGIYLMLSLVTYYTPGLGACGHYNTDTDYIVAVAHGTFDTYPYVMSL